MKTCRDIKEQLCLNTECCLSCHEDQEELGIEMCSLELDGEDIEVCCMVKLEAFNAITQRQSMNI